MEKKAIDWLSIVSLAITVLLSVFTDETNMQVIYPIIGVIVIVVIVNLILNKTKSNKNLSKTAVIDKSKKYTKFLLQLVKVNAKKISKDINKNEFIKLKNNNKQILKLINKETSNKNEKLQELLNEKYAILDNYYKTNQNYVSNELLSKNTPTKEMVAIADVNHSRQIFNKIYKTIEDIERILLQLEQHELRITLGKYVIKCSYNIDEIIHAYVDYLGWTNVLLGDNKKGFENIIKGINLIDYKLKSTKEYTPEYFKYLLLKARALRHLGTTYYTYKTPKDVFVKEKLQEAIKLMQDEKVKEYYYSDPKLKITYLKMVFGLIYNDLLYDYNMSLHMKDINADRLLSIKNRLLDLEKEIESCGFDDNHRLIKILTFKNQLDENIRYQKNIQIDDEWSASFDKDLKVIEGVLNKNIYFDEAMEVYICQKIQKLYYDIEKIMKN